VGQAKNTDRTGNFVLIHTGEDLVRSENGLLTTVAYKIGENKPVYALEGSIAVTGSLVQWVRDNLGLIEDAPEIEDLATQVDDNGGLFIVPAFSGLFAPHWRSDARGAMVGMTRFHNKHHIARATLEATAFQSREVLDAMVADAESEGVELSELKVDGGMVMNETLMQFQATSSACPWCARRSSRPPRSAPPTPPASRWGTGTESRTSSTTGPRTSAGSPRWTRRPAPARCACGRRPW